MRIRRNKRKRAPIKTMFILYHIERLAFSSLLSLQKLTEESCVDIPSRFFHDQYPLLSCKSASSFQFLRTVSPGLLSFLTNDLPPLPYPLQALTTLVLHPTVRLIFLAPNTDPVISVLQSLQWHPISWQIKYKFCSLIHKALLAQVCSYFAGHLSTDPMVQSKQTPEEVL